MLTLFGKFCRKLRIDNGELLKDMAVKLGVTPSYLSAVENGKRNVPHDWFEIISNEYNLSEDDRSQLRTSIEESQLSLKLEMKDLDNRDKNLIMAFAREFKELDDEKKDEIRNILISSLKGGKV